MATAAPPAAQLEQGEIILGVADPDDVVRRQAKLLQRRLQAACLVDAGRQHHDRAFVEDDLQLEPEIANGRENLGFMRLDRRDDHPAEGKQPEIQPLQALAEQDRRRLGEERFFLVLRPVEQGAILDDDEIEQIQPGKDALQILQLASGDHDQLAARPAQRLERFQGRIPHHPVGCQGAVIVGRERLIIQTCSPCVCRPT